MYAECMVLTKFDAYQMLNGHRHASFVRPHLRWVELHCIFFDILAMAVVMCQSMTNLRHCTGQQQRECLEVRQMSLYWCTELQMPGG